MIDLYPKQNDILVCKTQHFAQRPRSIAVDLNRKNSNSKSLKHSTLWLSDNV